MNLNEKNELDELLTHLKGVGLNLSLSKFVTLNYSVLIEIKKLYVPLKIQAEIVEKAIGKSVSMASLSVAMSRLKPEEVAAFKNEKAVIMRTTNTNRFFPKESVLTLGTQKEVIKIIKGGILIREEEALIDWRGLAPGENITNWIKEYQNRLIAINKTGWRWTQIAKAINEHLSLQKKISANTLTSIISLSNKKTKQIN